MGKTTDDLIRLAEDVSRVRPGRELDMLLTAGERISMALLCMALAELGVPAALVHRQPGRHHHRHDAHEGEDPRSAWGSAARVARRRHRPGRRRLSGSLERPRRDHARTRRLGHDGRGARRRPRRRSLRDLHRRPGGVHRRSPGRAERSPDATDLVRRDARDRRLGRARACRSARSNSPGTTTSRSTCVPASPGSREPSSARRTRPWNSPSSRR